MGRRQKTTLLEDLFELVSRFPWWIGVILAIASYFLLHAFAAPVAPVSINMHNAAAFTIRAILKVLAALLQYLVPVICFAAAGTSSSWR